MSNLAVQSPHASVEATLWADPHQASSTGISLDYADRSRPSRANGLPTWHQSPKGFFARLPAIPAGRKPLVAFAIGFLFGPLIAIYLRSWFDFFATVAAIFAVTVLLVALDATAAANAVPVLWGLWAMARVKHSRTRDSGTVAEA